MKKVSIVVPCYNEADRINSQAFQDFAHDNRNVHFIFVDDGSTDATYDLLATLCSSNPQRFHLLRLPSNIGKAEAVRSGILRGFTNRSDYVGMWDADLACPLDEISRFSNILDKIAQVQVVTGARVKMLGRNIQRYAMKHYIGRISATLISFVLGLPVYDTQCGAKLFRATEEVKAIFADPFRSRWLFDVEIIVRLVNCDRQDQVLEVTAPIYEMPLNEWVDKKGSNVRTMDYVRSLMDLLLIHWNYSLARRYSNQKQNVAHSVH